MSTVDPRYIKQLLQAQLRPTLDTLSEPAADGDDSFDFAGILNTIMMGVPDENAIDSTLAGSSKNAANNAASALAALSLKQQFPLSHAQQAHNQPTSYDDIVKQASSRYSVDPGLIHAVIGAESSYRPDVVSSAGAKGLMQLMDGTARQLGVADSFDPVQNINGGTQYLSSLLKRYNGNEAMALAAYNAGPGRVDALGVRSDEQLKSAMSQLPLETQKYVASIMAKRGSVSRIGETF